MRCHTGSRRRVLGLVALSLIACGGPTGGATPKGAASRVVLDVPPAPAQSSTSSRRPQTPVEPCHVAKAITEASIARAERYALSVIDRVTSTKDYAGPTHTGPIDSYYLTNWIQCLETPGGAWAIVLVKAQFSPTTSWDWSDFHLDGTLALVHVDRTGAVAQAAIGTETGASETSGEFFNRELFAPYLPNCCSQTFGGLGEPSLFDFDGDGEPEIHVSASYGHEGVHDQTDALFTFRAGRVEEYPPAKAYPFLEVEDETGDGIPDLSMAEELSGGEACGSGFPSDGRGLTFIAHALPGGSFSKDDEAARVHAKAQCPAPPAAIQSFKDVLCAKLWGRSKEELERVVRASFVDWDCAAEAAGRAQNPRARPDYTLMVSAAASRVPFTLR